MKMRALIPSGLGLAMACATPAPLPPPESPTAAAKAEANVLPSPIEEWRSVRPAPGKAPDIVLPTFAKDTIDTGLTILLAENHTLPVVTFSVVTRGGSALDPTKKEGLTALSYALLAEGAGKRGALEFSDAVADLGASFGTGSDQDRGSITISGLSENRDAMLALLSDVVLAPRLDSKDFERKKAEHLAGLVAAKGSPMGLAFQHVPALIYGDAHPYGHPASGTEASVGGLTINDVKSQLRTLSNPNQSALVVSGDITMGDAKALAKKYLGKWKGTKVKDKTYAAVEAKPRSKLIVVNKDRSPQTLVFLGRPIFGAGFADQTPLEVTNAIFGGEFSSRLNLKLREEKGYTYGARSAVSARRGVGALNAYAMVRADVTAESVTEFFKELEGLKGRPPDAAELDRVKSSMARGLPGDFETTGSVAGAAAQVFTYALPLDWYTSLPARIAAVDAAVVSQMIDKYFGPDKMLVLLVGEAESVSKAVEGLKLGTLEVRR